MAGTMEAVANRSGIAHREVTELRAALEQWYAAHSSIRRLWATADGAGIVVFVTIEPTVDGDDTLPVWLASERIWAKDLRQLTHRNLRLQLVLRDDWESCVDSEALLIAALDWRDSWESCWPFS